MEQAVKWLLLEGILPLLGATVLYMLWGCLTFIVSNQKPFAFQWSQAVDSLGWLYGASILGVQAGMRVLGQSNAGVIPYFCFGASAVCLLTLLAAMAERGRDTKWKPPVSMIVLSCILVIVVLAAGFVTQSMARAGASQ